MSTTLQDRITQRQALAKELAELDVRARKVRDEMSRIDADLTHRFSKLAQALGGEPEESQPDQETVEGPLIVGGADIDNWIQQALMDACRPLRPREIYHGIHRKGVEVSGKDPVNNISARLSSSDRFIRLGSGVGWWIRGEPIPEGFRRVAR